MSILKFYHGNTEENHENVGRITGLWVENRTGDIVNALE
jgi:hypothetical protein